MSAAENRQNATVTETSWISAARFIRFYGIPVVVIFGLLGNTLTLLVYCSKSMKKPKCVIYLTTIAVVDNVFLLVLATTWLNEYIYNIMTLKVSCQLVVYITYVTSSISTWCIVGLSCERFIAICYPLKIFNHCNGCKEKYVIFIFIITSSFVYCFSLWTTSITIIEDKYQCYFEFKYINLMTFFTWLDTVVTMMLPFIIIAFTNAMVFRAVLTSRKKTRFESFKTRQVLFTELKVRRKNVMGGHSNSTRKAARSQITVSLLVVSTTFLVLNLPSHVMRLRDLIAFSSVHTDVKIFFQELSLFLYFCTFCCNIMLYTAFGQNFRRSLVNLVRCVSHRQYTLRSPQRTFSVQSH